MFWGYSLPHLCYTSLPTWQCGFPGLERGNVGGQGRSWEFLAVKFNGLCLWATDKEGGLRDQFLQRIVEVQQLRRSSEGSSHWGLTVCRDVTLTSAARNYCYLSLSGKCAVWLFPYGTQPPELAIRWVGQSVKWMNNFFHNLPASFLQ